MANRHFPKVLARKLTSGLIGFMFVVLLIFTVQFAYYNVMPRSFFYTYYEVIPSKAVVGEHLIFVSDREIRQSYPMNFVDELQCTTNSHFREVAQRIGQDFRITAFERETPESLQARIDEGAGFEYEVFTPTEPMTCRLHTTATMELPYGVTKVQHLTSETFNIVER